MVADKLKKGRKRWLKGLRRQGILPRKVYSKAQAREKVETVIDRLGIVPAFKKKKTAKSAMNAVQKELVKELAEPPVYFYGHSASNGLRFFSNFYQTDIKITKAEFKSICHTVLPHAELEELDTPEPEWLFRSSEHLFMFLKALCMRDAASAKRIYTAATPALAKKLGRQVYPFDEGLWDKRGGICMFQAVMCKFNSDSKARAALMATGSRVLAEASPSDNKWGIGLSKAKAESGEGWCGSNLLGGILFNAREMFQELGQPLRWDCVFKEWVKGPPERKRKRKAGPMDIFLKKRK